MLENGQVPKQRAGDSKAMWRGEYKETVMPSAWWWWWYWYSHLLTLLLIYTTPMVVVLYRKNEDQLEEEVKCELCLAALS